MDIIVQGIRWVLWILCRFVLIITDGIFDIVTSFYEMNLSDFSWIWKIYWILAGTISLFIVARIIVMFFRSTIENDDSRFAGSTIISRIVIMFLIITFIPVGLPIFSNVASNATMIMTDNETKPSDILIEAGLASFEGDLNSSIDLGLAEGEHAVDVITQDTINDKRDDGQTYKYFNDLENILLIAVLSGMCVYAFISLAIQIVQRMVGLLLKITLAPYAMSGLVDPADNSASMWIRLTLADIMTQIFQIMLLWIVMHFVSNLPSTFNLLGKGLAFIGAVFAIIIAPSGIAQLLGGDVGTQTGMQMMQHFQALSGAVRLGGGIAKTGLELGGGLAVSGAKNLIAGGTYGIGRLAGGRTLNPNAVSASMSNMMNGGSGDSSGSSSSGGSFGSGSGGIGENQSSYASASGGNPTASMINSGGGGISDRTQSYIGEDGTPSVMSMLSQIEENTNPNYDNHQSAGFSVGNDGILHYDDGKTTNNDYHPNSFIGNMAGKAGAWAYQKSAQRLFNTAQQRNYMKQNSNSASLGNIGSNLVHNFHQPVANMQSRGSGNFNASTRNVMNNSMPNSINNQMNAPTNAQTEVEQSLSDLSDVGIEDYREEL